MCSMNEGKETQCGSNVKTCQQNILKGEVNMRKCGLEDPSGKTAVPNTCQKLRALDICFCEGELCNGVLPPCDIRKNKDDACAN